jgi:single-stranded-DNA-specific exonuclease
VVASVVKEIKKHLRLRETQGELPRILVFGNPDWRPALLGLVANSIVEDTQRPVFLWGRNGDDLLKGSCRSDGKTNLVALMEKAKHVFTQFGGHKMAGGFALAQEHVHTLEQVLNEMHEFAKDDEETVAWIDAELELSEVSWDLYKEISKFAPFGVGNEKPTFLFKNTFVSSVRQFGKEENHLEILLGDEDKKVKAIKFFSKPESFSKVVSAGKKYNIVANLEKSDFGYRPELRLRIIDIL